MKTQFLDSDNEILKEYNFLIPLSTFGGEDKWHHVIVFEGMPFCIDNVEFNLDSDTLKIFV